MNFGKVTMVMRGYTLEQVKCVAEVLLSARYARNLEITTNTEDALNILATISMEYGKKLHIGAGTVITFAQLQSVIDNGASFVLSPRMMSREMLFYCKAHEVIAVPGAFTPSEVGEMMDAGASIIKIFPADEVSFGYARKLREPLGDVKLMAVGGVNVHNIKEVFRSGYSYAATARGLFHPEDIRQMNRERMRQSLVHFEKEMDEGEHDS